MGKFSIKGQISGGNSKGKIRISTRSKQAVTGKEGLRLFIYLNHVDNDPAQSKHTQQF